MTNPDSYTVESSSFSLINPEKHGYRFTGWIGTELNKPTTKVIVETGSLGDRSYTATWEKKESPGPGPDDDNDDDSDTGDSSKILLCGIGMLLSLTGAFAVIRKRREE